jgi:hypothetical protein
LDQCRTGRVPVFSMPEHTCHHTQDGAVGQARRTFCVPTTSSRTSQAALPNATHVRPLDAWTGGG